MCVVLDKRHRQKGATATQGCKVLYKEISAIAEQIDPNDVKAGKKYKKALERLLAKHRMTMRQ